MKKLLLLVASLTVMLANSAGATIIVINPPATVPEFNSNVSDWTYAAVLQSDQIMRPGDFFTIFDFPFADALSAPQFGKTSVDPKALFQVSVNNVGNTPPNLNIPDNPNISNVTVTLLDGDGTQAGLQSIQSDPSSPNPNLRGQLQLGTLIVRSLTDARTNSNFAAIALGKLSPPNSVGISNGGTIEVAAIPEPGSVTLMLAGLIACGAIGLRRRMMD